MGDRTNKTADWISLHHLLFAEGRIKLYGITIKMAVATPNVKFRSDTVAITNALAARQNDLRIVPSCSEDGLLLIHSTHRATVESAIRDEVVYCIMIAYVKTEIER